MKKNRAVFCDLNGTLVTPVQVEKLSELRFLPYVKEALELLFSAGYIVPVITVQSRINRYFSQYEFLNWFDGFFEDLIATTNLISPPFVCPHQFSESCDCKKETGLLYFTAASQFNIDLNKSYIVGDTSNDLKAAKKIGIPGILVKTGWWESCDISLASFIGENLYDIAKLILKKDSRR